MKKEEHGRTPRFTLRLGDHLKSPASKLYYNEQVFSEIAPRYDLVTQVLSLWSDRRWKQRLIATLPVGGEPLCIDLACGTGDLAALLACRYPTGKVVGVDITEPMLALARRRHAFPNVEFVRQDMSRLDQACDSVDIVTGGYALRNAPDLEGALDEISRVLKPGGWAAFLDFSKPQSPLVQRLEYWVLKLWTGLWGILLHRNHEVYSYIAESLHAFPDRAQLHELLERKGFRAVKSERYFLGVTELTVVSKGATRDAPASLPVGGDARREAIP